VLFVLALDHELVPVANNPPKTAVAIEHYNESPILAIRYELITTTLDTSLLDVTTENQQRIACFTSKP